ncbi:MAG: universal stress protein [Bacteroidota bacterium]
MKRILLPTDFSKNAWNAMAYSEFIFEAIPCEFILLHCFSGSPSKSQLQNDAPESLSADLLLRATFLNRLEDIVRKARSPTPNPRHVFRVSAIPGDLVATIRKITVEEKIDCIIMGTKGASGLKKVFFGSTTYTTIKHATFCPVIAVPEDWENNIGKNTILLVTGYEHIFEAYEFTTILDIASLCNGRVMVGFMGKHRELGPAQLKSKESIHNHLQTIDLEFVEMREETFIYQSVQKMVTEHDEIGMIAMLEYWHSFFERITNEPVIKNIAFNPQVPFLVIPLKE